MILIVIPVGTGIMIIIKDRSIAATTTSAVTVRRSSRDVIHCNNDGDSNKNNKSMYEDKEEKHNC